MGELAPGSDFAGHRIESGGRPRRHGRRLPGDPARARPHGRAEGHRPGAARGSDGARARFVRESKVAASIDHPNVIPIYYAGEEDGDRVHRDALRRRRRPPQPRPARGPARARAGPRGSSRRSARRSTPRTPPASCTATSSPPTSCSAAEDHVYLTDFGLTKHALSIAGATKPGPLGRHARLRRARADPRRARRRARGRLRARLPALLRAHRRRAVPARGRRGAAVGAPVRAAAEADRARAAACRTRSTT